MLGGHMEYNVDLLWDEEACVWVATSDNIPGLVAESDSYAELIEKIDIYTNELITIKA